MTPEGKVLVMSDNVFEAGKGDARKSADMRNLVTRMKEMAPSNDAPDIFLVQEARKHSVWNIKRLMEKTFGCNYTIPVNAGKSPWKWIRKYTRLKGRDTAVIVNSDSMSVIRKGYRTHPYEHSKSGPRDKVKVKKTAWVQAIEENNPNQNRRRLRVLAASVHFPRGNSFRSDKVNKRLKRRFSVDIARFFENRLSDGTDHDEVIHVIGGDFNVKRHNGSPRRPTLPYKTLRRRPWFYKDGPIWHTTGAPNPIDFLFSTGKPLKARMDQSNNRHPGSKNFYSNHDLRWSLLAPYPRQ
jgi:hypothetical protein